ncbi:hypothetical protein MTO96_045759 [Rhipicephalus appendiculatus]
MVVLWLRGLPVNSTPSASVVVTLSPMGSPHMWGIPGNEAADCAAKEAHDARTAVSDAVCTADVARLLVARHTRGRHADPRVPAGNAPRLLPLRGLSRADLRLLLRLRIGCHRAAERLHRLTGRGSPYCADCGDREPLEHLLLHCTALDASRTPMLAEYARLGLPRTTAKHLLFPDCGRDSVKRALSALLVFLDDSGLRERI